jgi:hypothetical protein
MSDPAPSRLVLEGIAGWVQGERYPLAEGETIIGRSRSCTISLRRASGYLNQAPETRDDDHDFNAISRQHLSVTVQGLKVSIKDLSSNGTWCNGDLMDSQREWDCSDSAVTVRLGNRETFRVVRSDQPATTSLNAPQQVTTSTGQGLAAQPGTDDTGEQLFFDDTTARGG